MTSRVLATLFPERAGGLRRGFTVTELLVVIGILILLLALTLMVVSRAQHSAQVARIKKDLQTIATALETYKDHVNEGRGYPLVLHNADPASERGSYVLARWLIGPGPAAEDGHGAAGYRLSASTPVIEPLLPPEAFKVTRVAAGKWVILDHLGNEIQYYPRYMPARYPNQAGLVGQNSGARINPVAACFAFDVTDGAVPNSTLMAMLGDENLTNRIEPAPIEKLRFSGDFILASPGPDKAWTIVTPGNVRSALNDSDDVFNFER